MVDVRQQIISQIKKAIKDLTGQDITPNLEHPKDERHGEYSSNIAMAIFSSSKLKVKSTKFRTPFDLAQEIADKFKVKSLKLKVIEKVEVVPPGFINFWLSKDYLVSQLGEIAKKGNKYGSKPQDSEKKAVVEYSSPNIAKPFTIGHLRSTIIGDAIANLLEANGWRVYRDNHLGDWGTQFGKQIYAIKEWGNYEEIEKSKRPIEILVYLYVKFHKEAENNPKIENRGREWFKKLEDGDPEAKRLWKKCVEWSLKEFKKIYDVLHIDFTENKGLGYGESFFEDKMDGVIKELDEKGLLKESEGAKLVFFRNDKYPPLMIIKKDGTSLYATRDLATDKFRLNKYGKDVVIINEVGIEQSLYFKQLFEVEKMLGWVKEGQRIHFKHGHYRFKDEKMSTRKGNVIWLEEVLDEAVRRAYKLASDASINVNHEDPALVKQKLATDKRNRINHLMGEEEARKTARDIGIGSIKWNDLKRSSHLDIVFDWDEILNMEGNSGPYLQYTFARTQSVLAKALINVMPNSFRHLGSTTKKILKQVQDDNNIEPEELSVLRCMYRFPEVVGEAAEKFAPNVLCTYLFDLAQKFNLFYEKHKILNSEQAEFRISLTAAVGQIIKNGLNLLGIKAPDKM